MARLFNEILGKQVEVPDRPSRIISFSPAVTEILFMLGLGDRVVGVSAFCARPTEAREKRKVGSYNSVSRGILDELKPDVIFTVTGYQREFAMGLSESYPAFPLELPVSVAGIVDAVVKVGLVTGAREEARELAGRLLRLLGSTRRGRARRVYVEIDLGGPVSFGAYSYITDAIHFLGSSTIFDDRRLEWLTVDPREVRAADPDVVIYEPKMFKTFGREDFEGMLRARGWDDLRAVKSGNCFQTPGPFDFLAHHGPSFITVAIPWLQGVLGV